MKTGLFLLLGLLAAGVSLPSHAQEPVQVKVVRSEGRYAIRAGFASTANIPVRISGK